MVLILGEHEINIDSFTIGFDVRESQETVVVSKKDVDDFQAFVREVKDNYDNTFSLTTRLTTYTFVDYTLEGIDMFVEDTYNTVSIRFTKEV